MANIKTVNTKGGGKHLSNKLLAKRQVKPWAQGGHSNHMVGQQKVKPLTPC